MKQLICVICNPTKIIRIAYTFVVCVALIMNSLADRRGMILKIADFDEVTEHTHTTTLSARGTFAYMAPEVLQHQRFSKASDVWR